MCLAAFKVQERRRTADLIAAFDVGNDDHLSSKDSFCLLSCLAYF